MNNFFRHNTRKCKWLSHDIVQARKSHRKMDTDRIAFAELQELFLVECSCARPRYPVYKQASKDMERCFKVQMPMHIQIGCSCNSGNSRVKLQKGWPLDKPLLRFVAAEGYSMLCLTIGTLIYFYTVSTCKCSNKYFLFARVTNLLSANISRAWVNPRTQSVFLWADSVFLSASETFLYNCEILRHIEIF